ncbi:MAG: hypothetical protein RBT63_07315 [Bdellovibrionales bacterium]|nr:hypothetical protein [Bdellovibrionales bacterium]
MSFNSREFKRCQADWYARLGSSGFDDIERHGSVAPQVFSVHNSEARSNDYYAHVDRLVEQSDIPPHKREVLKLHAQGVSLSRISKELSQKFKVPRTRSGMHRLIQGLLKKYPDLRRKE